MKRVFNFSAGPATLPVPVLEEASRGVLEIAGSGMSILEVSHRGKQYEAIHAETKERLLRIMGLSASEYSVLFMGGGASTQFTLLPMNFLREGESADYVHTGEWSGKALKEVGRFGVAKTVASSEAQKFAAIPTGLSASAGARYFHFTSNNTIEGTQFASVPSVGAVPLVSDMSSDFLSREFEFGKFSLIYAGAQKNAGPAGVTVVVVRNGFLEQANENLPTMFAYKTHAKNDSLYNTPPVFSIYVVGLVLKWIEGQGGLKSIQATNERKAQKIYTALDQYPDFYDVVVKEKTHRSRMNLTFRLKNADLEKSFLQGAEAQEMDGLKGHRSVGGLRASIYNAFPEAGCDRLAEYIHEFARR